MHDFNGPSAVQTQGRELNKHLHSFRIADPLLKPLEDAASELLATSPLEAAAGLASLCDCGAPMQAAVVMAVMKNRLSELDRENHRLQCFNRQLVESLADSLHRNSEVQHRAMHDGLTGLPNRELLLQRLQECIVSAFQLKKELALMFIDLDGFKVVNDRYGHGTGDKLLTVVATRLAACVRANDVACRYGGDEFVVMLPDLPNANIALSIVESIRCCIDGRYVIDGQEMEIGVSIGLSMYPVDGEHGAALIHSADASMYRCKQMSAQKRQIRQTASCAGNAAY